MSKGTADVRTLAPEEVWDFPADSRLVAIRWDLLEWGLVLDFDVPESEAADAKMHRGWLAFDGVSEVTIPFEHSRLPTGCFASGGLGERESNGRFHEYFLSALFPTFNETDLLEPRPAKDVIIKALRVIGMLSLASAERGQNGLAYAVRNELASDEVLRRELSRALQHAPTKSR